MCVTTNMHIVCWVTLVFHARIFSRISCDISCKNIRLKISVKIWVKIRLKKYVNTFTYFPKIRDIFSRKSFIPFSGTSSYVKFTACHWHLTRYTAHATHPWVSCIICLLLVTNNSSLVCDLCTFLLCLRSTVINNK